MEKKKHMHKECSSTQQLRMNPTVFCYLNTNNLSSITTHISCITPA